MEKALSVGKQKCRLDFADCSRNSTRYAPKNTSISMLTLLSNHVCCSDSFMYVMYPYSLLLGMPQHARSLSECNYNLTNLFCFFLIPSLLNLIKLNIFFYNIIPSYKINFINFYNYNYIKVSPKCS